MGLSADNPKGELYCPTCETTFSAGDRCPTDNTRLVRLAKAPDALLGRELDGRYTVLERLGAGGMGAVYRGTQHSVGRDIAIKVVTPSLISEEVAIKRFLREAKLASRLSHPNAVSVLDFGQTEDGLFYLVMELVAGRTLDKVIEAEGPLSPARLVRIGAQICDALEGAHAIDIVHRDLKPQNVMIMSSGRDFVKVLDFGLAKSLQSGAGLGVTTMTNAGAILGTPAFMPPELASGEACDGRADLYSLGCVLHYAATGEQPFKATTVHELIAMHATEPAPRIPKIGVLAQVIQRLLEKQPGRRFQTAAETREALELALATPLVDVPDLDDLANNLDADTELQAGPPRGLPTMIGGWTTHPPEPGSPPGSSGAPAVRPSSLPVSLSATGVQPLTPSGGVPIPGAPMPVTPASGVRMYVPQKTTPGHAPARPSSPPQRLATAPPIAPPKRSKAGWWIAIAAIIVGVAIAGIALRSSGSSAVTPPAEPTGGGSSVVEPPPSESPAADPWGGPLAPTSPAAPPSEQTPPSGVTSPPPPETKSSAEPGPTRPEIPGQVGPRPTPKRRPFRPVTRGD